MSANSGPPVGTAAASAAAPSVSFEKPPIPLVWVDTWVVVRIAKARNGELPDGERAEAMHLHDLFMKLRDAERILCPETGQLIEIEAGGRLVDEAKTVLSQISGGVKTHYLHAQEQQVYRAMRAFAHGSPTIELVWRDLFVVDPIEERRRRGGLLIRADFPRSEAELAELRAGNKRLADGLEGLRQRCLAERVTPEEQAERERSAMIQASADIVRELYAKIAAGTAAAADFIRYVNVVGTPMGVLSVYMKEVRGAPAGPEDLMRFYQSPYYRELPSVRLIADLYAAKLTGTEVIRPSDVMDINQIASVLPYATFVATDASMTDKIGRLRLDERHGGRVVRRISDLIEVLEKRQ